MKKFNDLVFATRKSLGGVISSMDFDNGYGVSVIQGPYAYTSGPGEYELAVLKDGHLCYDTPVTEDVEGHLSRDGVSELMRQVQQLGETMLTKDGKK